MIKACKCVGIRKGKLKDGRVCSTLYFNVTACIPENDRVGEYFSHIFLSKDIPNSVVGCDIICSVDNFKCIVTDIEL